MRYRDLVLFPLMFAAAAAPAGAQAPLHNTAAWRDPAPHKLQFITVSRGVKLDVPDWGGTGPTRVFLAGLGNTAHAWDTFIPKFTDSYRIVAITRRGFGASSHPNGGYELTNLVNDVRKVMDTLRIQRATLVGHSIAAEEL